MSREETKSMLSEDNDLCRSTEYERVIYVVENAEPLGYFLLVWVRYPSYIDLIVPLSTIIFKLQSVISM